MALVLTSFALPMAARGEIVINEWDVRFFSYTRNIKLAVEETTPTSEQVGTGARPPQMQANMPRPVATTRPAQPLAVGPLNVVHLRFRDADGFDVPVLLGVPRDKTGPFPLVIATHGMGGDKAQALMQFGPPLAAAGFAVMAADLPNHGEQPGEPKDITQGGILYKMFPNLRRGVIDLRQCIDVAEKRPELDVRNGVVLAGVSFGTVIDTLAGPSDKRVKGMCLLVAGCREFPAGATAHPQLASLDSQLSMPHFAPRPVLMLNGTHDDIVTPDMARRLFDATSQPKQQKWYDSGHGLPGQAMDDAVAWITQLMKAKP